MRRSSSGCPGLAPTLRARAIQALFRRGEWTASLVVALEKNQVRLGELVLDQKQALAAHPSAAIAERRSGYSDAAAAFPTPTASA